MVKRKHFTAIPGCWEVCYELSKCSTQLSQEVGTAIDLEMIHQVTKSAPWI